jgi:medium-chain acyl-[acyl-carrier-protein] hydrolase
MLPCQLGSTKEYLFLVSQTGWQSHVTGILEDGTMLENRSVSGSRTKGSAWTGSFRPSESARLTLFCFPYAGGTSLIFKNWAALMPNMIDICPIHLPGRSGRLHEAPFRSIEPLVRALGEALLPYLAKPYVLFGHSMGALISFELARHYRSQQISPPIHIFASGRRAPQLPDPDPPTFDLSDAEFKEELRRLNGTPSDVLENFELLQLMMPVLRADFEVCQSYEYKEELPLSCPITAFGGIGDIDVPRSTIEAWRQQTSSTFVMRMMPGDHFFLHSNERLIVHTLARDLYPAMK